MTGGNRLIQRYCMGFLTLSISLIAQSQSIQPLPTQDRGVVPGRTFDISSVENISIESGNLFLHIPLGSFPSGPGGSTFSVALNYNSQIFDIGPAGPGSSSTGGGWTYGFQYSLRNDQGPADLNLAPGVDCQREHRLSVVFPDGSQKLLFLDIPGDPPGGVNGDAFFDVDPSTGVGTQVVGLDTYPACASSIPNPLVYYTADGTFTRLELTTAPLGSPDSAHTWTLYLPDGSRVFGVGLSSPSMQRIVDRNGNTISFSYGQTSASQPKVTLQDQLGRTMTLVYQTPFAQQFPTDTLDAPGPNSTTLHTVINWASTSPTYQLGWFGCEPTFSVRCVLPPANYGISSIQLPPVNGTTLQYSFAYNSNDADQGWGEVKSVTFPYGAKSQYGYQNTANATVWVAGAAVGPQDPIVSKTLTYTDSIGSQRSETWCYTVWATFGNTAQDQCTGSTIDSFTKLVVNPDGGVRKYVREATTSAEEDATPQLIRIIEPNGDVTDRTWRENFPGPNTIAMASWINPYLKAEFRTVQSSLGPQTSTAIFSYDRNGNMLTESHYDFVPVSSFNQLATEPSGSRVPQVPTGATLVRTITNTYALNSGASIDSGTPQDNSLGYWRPLESAAGQPALLTARLATEAGDSNGTASRVEYAYDNALTTGNVTGERSWDSAIGTYSNPLTASNSIVNQRGYDAAGDVTTITDPNGVLTTYDMTGCGGGGPGGLPNSVTKAGLTTSFVYDCSTGLVTLTTDPNGVHTAKAYDGVGRLAVVCEGANAINSSNQCQWDAAVGRRALISYLESPGVPLPLTVTTAMDLISRGDGAFVSTQQFDQLGHVASDQKGDAITQHLGALVSANSTYEATSNPQFASSDATAGWTRITRDTMGRPVRTDYFDGSALPAPWGTNGTSTAFSLIQYDGYSTTITDESGKIRQQIVDGGGRLTTVIEDPGTPPNNLAYSTSYLYNANDDLTLVCQNGSISSGMCQNGLARNFSYSSLRRLRTASNPETGPVNYTYDNNGNLLTKIDNRQVKSTYGFDDLNRLRSKTYNDGTATATLCYGDDASNRSVSRGAGPNLLTVSWSCASAPTGALTKGRLTLTSGDGSNTTYSPDALGQIISSQQTTNNIPYGFSFTRNANGDLASATFPSGRVLDWSYDNSARPTGVSGAFQSAATTYAGPSTATPEYWPNGTLRSAQLSPGSSAMTVSSTLDTRLRPSLLSMTASSGTETIGYTWNANGNLATETISNPLNPASLTQTFGYDGVNRLISASESDGVSQTWKQNYGYDAYGNRSLLTSSSLNPYPGVTPGAPDPPTLGQTVQGPFTNNRFTGAQYDGGGNINGGAVTMTTFSTAAYDAENRVLTLTEPPNYMRYYYDGEGRRVMKVVCGSTPCTVATSGAKVTTFVYDAEGQLAAEYGGAAPVTGTQYLFADPLGSTRALLSSTGTFIRCYDYVPFGGELSTGTGGRANCYTDVAYPSASPEAESVKFTGKERDGETGLDYFGARYFSAAQGRWTSPDRLNLTRARLVNPSNTLNKYVYGGNNPLKYVDKDGKDITVFFRPPSFFNPTDWGHIFLAAFNQKTGKVGFLDFYPRSGGNGPGVFNQGNMQERAATANQFLTLTIQTQPEEAQRVLDLIQKLTSGDAPDYAALSNNCTTVCETVLHDLGLDFGDILPQSYWNDVYRNFSPAVQENPFKALFVPRTPGIDYGNARDYGVNFTQLLFQLYASQWQQQQSQQKPPKACVTILGPNGSETTCE